MKEPNYFKKLKQLNFCTLMGFQKDGTVFRLAPVAGVLTKA